jgi:MYXO-CTERM domain-containing protein
MSSDTTKRALQAALLMVTALILTLWTGSASAAGQIKWKSKTLDERNKTSWVVELELHMPKPPDVAHVPVKFEFEPTVYYERSMMDGDKLVERKVPLENRQPMIESVDIGFLDPGTGKIEKRTRFSFKVTRAQGYEAGEYKVTVRDGRSGSTIGAPATLIFKGENETIDRRAMVFSESKKKKAPEEKQDDQAATAGTQKIDLNAPEEGESAGSEQKSSSSAPASSASDAALAEDDEPQTIKEKPGGCGCRVPGNGSPGSSGLLILGASLAAAGVARRRQRSRVESQRVG